MRFILITLVVLSIHPTFCQSDKADKIAQSCYEFLSNQTDISFENNASMYYNMDSLIVTEHFQVLTEVKNHQQARFQVFDGKKTKLLNFDGSKLTIVSIEDAFFSEYDVKGDFKILSDFVKDSLKYEFPLAVLLQKNASKTISDLKPWSYYAGLIKVDGILVHHLVFKVKGFSWQLYVSADKNRPVPVKVIIADHEQKTLYTADLGNWDFAEISKTRFKSNINGFTRIK